MALSHFSVSDWTFSSQKQQYFCIASAFLKIESLKDFFDTNVARVEEWAKISGAFVNLPDINLLFVSTVNCEMRNGYKF